MIRLAYNNNFLPFASNNQGRAEGLIIDVLSAALAKVHIDVVFVPVLMYEIQKMLIDGAVDFIAFTLSGYVSLISVIQLLRRARLSLLNLTILLNSSWKNTKGGRL